LNCSRCNRCRGKKREMSLWTRNSKAYVLIWKAWHDKQPPGPGTLYVTGEGSFPTSGYTVELRTNYSDTISGTKDSRPGLNQLMADCHRRRIDVVLVWKFDRFARSVSHLLRALETFEELGVEFVSISEQVDTPTDSGKMIFTARRRQAHHH
jgi:hypothetical protein